MVDARYVGLGTILILAMWPVIFWLSPSQSSNVDLLAWLFAPIGLAALWAIAYGAAQAHIGGIAVVWNHGHSATAHGGPTFEIPARDIYPRLVGVALGGGNFAGVVIPGGKLKGWLIAPKDLVDNVNGRLFCWADVERRTLMELPAHVISKLEQEERFYDIGTDIYLFGLLPIKDLDRGRRSYEVDMDEFQDKLARINLAKNELEADHRTQISISKLDREARDRAVVRAHESDKPSKTERFKEGMTGDDDR